MSFFKKMSQKTWEEKYKAKAMEYNQKEIENADSDSNPLTPAKLREIALKEKALADQHSSKGQKK